MILQLTTRLNLPITQNMIACKKRQLYSQIQTKIALSYLCATVSPIPYSWMRAIGKLEE